MEAQATEPEVIRPSSESALAHIASSREVTEAQAAIMVAKRFPRNEIDVLDKVLLACQRPSLAETALYEYSRGGTAISGPSIRMAETLIRLWGNAACGLRELERGERESTIEAYAVDFETNVRHSKVFSVKHERATKKGIYKLEDMRDRYENLANFGARRMRACILSLIPSDIVEAAVNEVESTLKAKADTSEQAVKKLADAFAQFGVTKEQIEKKIQRRLDAITPAQVIRLRKIYTSLKDSMSTSADWFEQEEPTEGDKKGKTEVLKDKLKGGKKKDDPPKAEAHKTIQCPNVFEGPADIDPALCDTCESRNGCPAHE